MRDIGLGPRKTPATSPEEFVQTLQAKIVALEQENKSLTAKLKKATQKSGGGGA